MDSDYLRHLGRPVRFHLSDTSCFSYHTTGYKVGVIVEGFQEIIIAAGSPLHSIRQRPQKGRCLAYFMDIRPELEIFSIPAPIG